MHAHAMAATFLKCSILAGLIVALWGCDGSSGSIGRTPGDVALSGSIAIEAGTRVDADDGETLALGASPESDAQLLPPEFVLAGYVSPAFGVYSGAGDGPGNVYPADPVDIFTLPLHAEQSISLQPFATSQGPSPLRLSLFTGNRLIATASTGNQSDPVQISLPETEPAGSYSLAVEATGFEPMLYILSTSTAGNALSAGFEWPDHDFVDSEAIVEFKQGMSQMSQHSFGPQESMEPKRELSPGVWLVQAPAQALRNSGLQTQDSTLEWVRALSKRADVVSATPNYKMRAMNTTPLNEPLYNHLSVGQQWHYELVNAPTAWQLASDGGAGVTVAVMDTGLYGEPGNWHSELDANVVGGADFVSAGFDNDFDLPSGRDNDPSDPGNAVGTSVYHGTHVSGTIAAAVNGAGGAGIAYNASLLPVRVLGEGGTGSSADLLAALRWIAGSAGDRRRADIVNLSLGGLPFQSQLNEAIADGVSKGVVFVAAAGNSASTLASYPAAYDQVFSVSAVDGAGELSAYSNSGSWIDLAAPGGDASRDGNADGRSDLISSTSASLINGSLKETYIGLQGTSMAAPHVSAVFALMKSLNPALDHGRLRAMLMAGDLTFQDCGREICAKTVDRGWGLLDAGKSTLAASTAVVPNLLASSPAIVSLSSEGSSSASVTLSVYGSDPGLVTIESVSVNAPWVRLDSAPASGATGTEFILSLTLRPEALEAGISTRAPIVVEYKSDRLRRLEIPVIGQRVTDQQARDAGRHFVLLVDPESEGDFYTTVAQTTAVVDNGQYRFSFAPDDGVEPQTLNEVPPGNYILVAGSDLDNDGLICHAGEACAEYPVTGLRQEITISPGQSLTGIEMTTSYSRPSISAATPNVLPRPGFRGYKLLPEQIESGSGHEPAHKLIGAER
ncbi:S8 family serine peptidase [Marinobacter sp. S6332]|uniref:S8 family serine peptidase n=1 Tax=Marinobacter sp. S6332 TaxID=2926403 RepID=UPI001FF5C3A4|nr:S8 family serine peptidase [Marinobacter sp. S6332]MCK0162781.1 S8 family serine peptidase [Marinobacter sp. S6332]